MQGETVISYHEEKSGEEGKEKVISSFASK
jgi:hypothetical protein